MNRYAQMKQRQQREFNAFPMQFAFSEKQFAEGMEQLGLNPSETDNVYKAPGGGFYRKEDSQRLKEMFGRFDQGMKEAVAADKTGDGFIYEMFLYELENHEYSYTGELDEALEALGYTLADVLADGRLAHGLQKAMQAATGG